MWHSYLINLDENIARMKNSRRQFDAEKIDFSRIAAVNGWKLDDRQIAEVYDKKGANRYFKYPLVKPEIGCYLSHIKAWQCIVESGENGGFVFEDDFEIRSPLAPILKLLSSPDYDWDMVKLFSLKENPKFISVEKLDPNHNLTTPYMVPSCLLGYGITADGAKRLLKSSVPFFRPVDEDHKFFWEKKLSIALVCPSPITIGYQQTQTGTIGEVRNKSIRGSLANRLARGLKSLSYQLNYKLRLHYYRKFGSWK